MKSLICYKTKHGATKKYMEWLADEINAELKTFDDIKMKDDFSGYDNIVISSGTYAGFMSLNRFLKRHWKKLQDENVTVVAVGAAPADDSWSLWSYNRIPLRIRERVKYFKILGDTPESARKTDYVSPVKKENLVEIIKEIMQKGEASIE